MVGTGSQERRLLELERPRKMKEQPGGALVLPPIMDPDKWTAIAEPAQAKLASQTREDIK